MCAILAAAPLAAGPRSGDKQDWATLEDARSSLPIRNAAANALCERAKALGHCHEVAAKLLDFATKPTTPPDLARLVAEAVGACGDDKTAKLLATGMQKGSLEDRLLHARGGQKLASPIVDEAALLLLSDKEARLRAEALELLVAHRSRSALPKLAEIVDKGKPPDLLGDAVRGMSALLAGEPGWPEWEARLLAFGGSPVDELRRSALGVLARNHDPARFDYWIALLDHPDWSTRLMSVGWLELARTKPAVRALVVRLAKEQLGSRPFADIDEALGRATGMGRWETAEEWAVWWANVEAKFEFPAPAGTSSAPPERAAPSLGTGGGFTKFYGIEVESKRAIFVIDISGSMNEPSKSPDQAGKTRMDVAKAELAKLLDELPEGSWFNILTFSGMVEPWLDSLADSSGSKPEGRKPRKPATGAGKGDPAKPAPKDEKEAKREEEKRKKQEQELRRKAKEHVAALGALGGTNIHDSLQGAFADPDVDTIFFLTDGEPSAGAEMDPASILAAVRRWNHGRGVRIHTVAVGTNFPLLQALSREHGGEHRFIE